MVRVCIFIVIQNLAHTYPVLLVSWIGVCSRKPKGYQVSWLCSRSHNRFLADPGRELLTPGPVLSAELLLTSLEWASLRLIRHPFGRKQNISSTKNEVQSLPSPPFKRDKRSKDGCCIQELLEDVALFAQYSWGLRRFFPKHRKAEEVDSLAWCRGSCRGLAKLQASERRIDQKTRNAALFF